MWYVAWQRSRFIPQSSGGRSDFAHFFVLPSEVIIGHEFVVSRSLFMQGTKHRVSDILEVFLLSLCKDSQNNFRDFVQQLMISCHLSKTALQQSGLFSILLNYISFGVGSIC